MDLNKYTYIHTYILKNYTNNIWCKTTKIGSLAAIPRLKQRGMMVAKGNAKRLTALSMHCITLDFDFQGHPRSNLMV